MSSLVFSCDSHDYIDRRSEYRGPLGQEYYEGDNQILPGAEIGVRIEKRVECAFPIYSLHTHSDLLFRRTWSHIRRDKTDVTIIWFVKRGRAVISNHRGRQIINSGECTITRSLEPFAMENLVDAQSRHEALHVVVPTYMLRRYIPDAVGSGTAFPFDHGECHVAASSFMALFEEGDRVDARVAEDLMRASFGALGHCMSRSVNAASPTLGEKRFGDVLEWMTKNLSNPDVTVAAVARGCGISDRYVCRLLKAHNTSFSQVLWNSRLEQTKEWLAFSDERGLSIAKISYMAGFKSAAHFSRMFKRVVGVTPGVFRETSSIDESESSDSGVQPLNEGLTSGDRARRRYNRHPPSSPIHA